MRVEKSKYETVALILLTSVAQSVSTTQPFTKSNVSTTAPQLAGIWRLSFQGLAAQTQPFSRPYNTSTEESLDELNRFAQTLRNCQQSSKIIGNSCQVSAKHCSPLQRGDSETECKWIQSNYSSSLSLAVSLEKDQQQKKKIFSVLKQCTQTFLDCRLEPVYVKLADCDSTASAASALVTPKTDPVRFLQKSQGYMHAIY